MRVFFNAMMIVRDDSSVSEDVEARAWEEWPMDRDSSLSSHR